MKKIPLLLSLLPAIVLYAQPTAHSTFQHDNKHSGGYQSGKGEALDKLRWTFKTGGKIFGSAAVGEGMVFIGSEDKYLYAVDIANHNLRWKFLTGGPVYSTPAFDRHTVYFGSYDSYFYAVDAVTGKQCWKFATNGEKKVGAKGLWTMKPVSEYMDDPFDFFLSSPVLDDKAGIVYFGSGDGYIYALHATNGSLAWKFKTNGIVHTSPALHEGTVYAGSWDQYVYAIDAKTGEEKWKFKTGADTAYHLLEGIQSSCTVYEGMVYVGARDGFFYGLDAATGRLAWKYSANNSWILTTAAAKDGTIYIGTSDTYRFLGLDAKTGVEKFRVQANGYIYSSPAISGHIAYFGDFTGQMFAVDLQAKGKILDRFVTPGRNLNASKILDNDKIDFAFLVKGLDLSLYSTTVVGMDKLYTLGPILSSPVIADGNIYFGSADGNLYALKLKP